MPDWKCFNYMYLVGSCVGGALFPDSTSTQYLRFKFTLIVLDFRHVKYCSMCMYVYVKHNVKQLLSASGKRIYRADGRGVGSNPE